MGSKIREALFRRAACFLCAVYVVWPTRVATVVKPSPEMLSCLKKMPSVAYCRARGHKRPGAVAGHVGSSTRCRRPRVLSFSPALLALQAQDKAIRRELRLPHAWRQQEGVQDRAQREDARGEGELARFCFGASPMHFFSSNVFFLCNATGNVGLQSLVGL